MKVRDVIEALSQLDPDARCGLFSNLDLLHFERIDVNGYGSSAEVYFGVTPLSPRDEREFAERKEMKLVDREIEEAEEELRAMKRRRNERRAKPCP